MTPKKLILVAGPTAVGKTAFCIQLASCMQAEIFSCDSRQFYRELSIGTAKPTPEELSLVKHHFINSLSIGEDYSAGDYEREITEALEIYFQTHDTAILTGGSGLFMKAVTHGLDDMPGVPQELRDQLMKEVETIGLHNLTEQLRQLDPEYASKADLNNTQRVVRALEVCLHTGKPFSLWHNKPSKKPAYELIKIGLDLPREILYDRINQRVDEMVQSGLIDEVKNLVPYRNKNALKTVGYKEVFDYLDGQVDLTEMTELIKRNTRRYAKRQLTWFRNQDDFTWFSPNDLELSIQYIEKISPSAH